MVPDGEKESTLWLERFEDPQLLRESALFHRYCATAKTGEAVLVVVGAPTAPAGKVRTSLDEAARVLRLLDHANIPTVDERGRVGEIEFLSLQCDVHDDLARLWQHLAAAGMKLPMTGSSGLANKFLDVLASAHAVTDPNTGGPVCMGRFCWANVMLSETGKPWFLGWGDDLLVTQPDFTGASVVAPEVTLGTRPTPGADLWAILTLFRTLFALREIPPGLERILKGHPRPEDAELQAKLEQVHASILVPPERRTQSVTEIHDQYRKIWALLGIEPALEEFQVAMFAARSRADREPRARSGTDQGIIGPSRYRIDRELGAGSTATVYLARDRQLGVDVAIKSLRDKAHPRTFARFLREARLLRRIAHPHVVRGFDVEVHDGGVFLIMEYIAGTPLRGWARTVALSTRLSILWQVADALSALHVLGIVHGDIKPTNVIVTPDRGAVVVDLGAARDTHEEARSMSLAPGTPGYLAPERHDGYAATSASDVFSLAVTAIVILSEATSEPKTRASSALAIDKLQLDDAIATQLRAALNEDPDARPTAAELARVFSPRSGKVPAQLTVGPDGSWFSVRGEERISLRRRHAASRILYALAQQAVSSAPQGLSTFDLLEVGWPGERMQADAGAHRVHVALSTLRKLGCGSHLAKFKDGYRLDGVVVLGA